MLQLYAPTPFGLGIALSDELKAMGVKNVQPGPAGVSWQGPLEQAYRVCLWSRVASRVLVQVGRFPAPDGEALYAGAHKLDWSAHVDPDLTLAVRTSVRQAAIRHSGFAAKKLKDAVVDRLRDDHGRRPSVDLRQPDLSIHLHLQGAWATVSVDLAGESLHRRGYRAKGAEAPLKENLAAAILALLDWPAIASEGGAFVDPMCGSGTLLVEAAWMAGDRAPALERERWGFLGWRGHQPELWVPLQAEAEERAAAGLTALPPIVGYDAERAAVADSIGAVERAGLAGKVHVERRELNRCEPPARGGDHVGLVAVNPPYGTRLGTPGQLGPLYAGLAAQLAERFAGWRAGVLTVPELVGQLGISPGRITPLRNGALECELVSWRVSSPKSERPPALDARTSRLIAADGPEPPGVADFVARLKKRAKHLGRWAKRQNIECYRVYDADLADYNVAIDRYGDRVHVQEFAPPSHVDPDLAERRLGVVMAKVPEVLQVRPEHVALKTRRRQRGGDQYDRYDDRGDFFEVKEGDCAFLVNLEDYLDTGLFLDHRIVREMVGLLADNGRVLNLYGYTATASVHAARGGAISTTTVDRSNTYLGWAERNLKLNGLDERRHELVRADVLPWLGRQRERWDLIYVDPPTFSNAKGYAADFDVQRDHLDLIQACLDHLAPGGAILFTTHSRRFTLDREVLEGWNVTVEDRSRISIPEDFARSPRIHQCFLLSR